MLPAGIIMELLLVFEVVLSVPLLLSCLSVADPEMPCLPPASLSNFPRVTTSRVVMLLALSCLWVSFSLPINLELPERQAYLTEIEATVNHPVCQYLQASSSLPISGLSFDLSDLEGMGD